MQPGHISETVIQKILSAGGGYLPIIDAFDLKGWSIILNLSVDRVAHHVKEMKIPYKQIGAGRWFTVSDFWGAYSYSEDSGG